MQSKHLAKGKIALQKKPPGPISDPGGGKKVRKSQVNSEACPKNVTEGSFSEGVLRVKTPSPSRAYLVM